MISKRLRYEVLRRDNHACRYCGATAPDTPLTVDHVVPTALGGTDEPTNLVTACADCNGGKTSTTPGAELVADVEQDALRWAAAMKRAAEIQQVERDRVESILLHFEHTWLGWHWGDDDDQFPLPHDWRASLERMLQAGATTSDLAYAIETAMHSRAHVDRVFRYFAGVIWRLIADRQELAKSLLTEG